MTDLETIESLLADGTPHRLHSLGVTGIGLSGVSALFKARGWNVSGCDAKPAPEIAAWLRGHDIDVMTGHSAEHISVKTPDLILRSPAVSEDAPEIVAARERGIPVVRRGIALAALVNQSRGVAVCGTHGKTTSSTFVQTLLSRLGANPAWCIGGYTDTMGGVAGTGGGRDVPFVVEADESDGTLALYRPFVTLLTCIEPDHLEHFDSFDDLKRCFGAAVEATRGVVVYCADDPAAAEVAGPQSGKRMSYGISSDADVRVDDVVLQADSSTFTICFGGKTYDVAINVPGRHNVLNAAGAFAACVALGHDPADVARTMFALSELPHRRFEATKTADGIRVVSDYSHHPTEIAALVETARLSAPKRIVAAFQPHRYTRTKALVHDFPKAFAGVDELLLLPVYAASEASLAGGKSEDLYREFREQHENDATIPVPKLVPSVDAAYAYLATSVGADETILVVGAGDIVALVPKLRDIRPSEGNGGTRVSTSFGVGGTADRVVVAEAEDELLAVLADARANGVESRVLGQGTNVLVSDSGLRGITIRLSPLGFGAIERIDDTHIRVGTGTPGAALLSYLTNEGLSGLEYMVGIPGCVGGWLAMNAGTRFGEFGDRVVDFTAYGFEGDKIVIKKDDAGFAYRTCAALSERIAVSVTLDLVPAASEAIRAKMDELRAKRFNFAGLHTAGSVFRNPPGDSAGRLLEAAGCKGLRVGGAYVCERHANIIAAENGGTASDIEALSTLMHDRVAEQFGIDLQREIRIW